MSIRGNSSLNIKFTQIDSKFSSTFSVHWSGEFRFCVSTIANFYVHQLLSTPISAWNSFWKCSVIISKDVDIRVCWSVNFRVHWFSSPLIFEPVDFRVQGRDAILVNHCIFTVKPYSSTHTFASAREGGLGRTELCKRALFYMCKHQMSISSTTDNFPDFLRPFSVCE